jgi:hypothetical protein
MAAATNAMLQVSVPAENAWTVATRYSANVVKWTARQTFFGIRARSSEVTSIAASRYIPTMPHATATGRHEPVSGTRTFTSPKCT